ncbi:hypothetical protein KRR39_03005 [Nocardioides panacis]|uniref:Uncharacterized protein n=1 Tax=Nocardioides panacis TaxID=2849501 RepID=A0A975T0X9_9ACTN|nr:hypothetical protein [Nocardioides panacis]QWZ08838.1 hypothetical protein KRR39_03005 [Nocardioides panacis]
MFPGSETQWNGVTDMTDAGLLAEQMHWAATTPAASDTAFNVANGDVFRWRWMWPRLADRLGVRAEGYDARPRPLEQQMAGAAPVWAALAAREGLREQDLARSRAAGFAGHRSTLACFLELFDRLESDRVVPTPG